MNQYTCPFWIWGRSCILSTAPASDSSLRIGVSNPFFRHFQKCFAMPVKFVLNLNFSSLFQRIPLFILRGGLLVSPNWRPLILWCFSVDCIYYFFQVGCQLGVCSYGFGGFLPTSINIQWGELQAFLCYSLRVSEIGHIFALCILHAWFMFVSLFVCICSIVTSPFRDGTTITIDSI